MKIVMVSNVRMNPYVRLLATALEQVEPSVACFFEEALTPPVVARWQGRADVMHIHWAELLTRSSSPLRSARKRIALPVALIQAHQAGISLVYTAHNISRYEEGSWLDAFTQAMVYRLVDVVHVHDADAQARLLARYRPRRVAVIAHGNYIGAYPSTCTREEARRRFGFAGHDIVFLALGHVRPYKGLDELISAFRELEGDYLRLLIAGHPHDAAYSRQLTTLCGSDRRIRLDLRFIPDAELQFYLRAADVCVLPYRSATTSGAAILALSFGLPIVAPDIGPFPLLVTPDSGILYSARPGALREALVAASQLDFVRASTAAFAVACGLDWRPIARQHLNVYESLHRVRQYAPEDG